jgi:hypothetical protein
MWEKCKCSAASKRQVLMTRPEKTAFQPTTTITGATQTGPHDAARRGIGLRHSRMTVSNES